MSLKKLAIFVLCILSGVFLITTDITYAADATVVFGSDSYENNIGAEFPIGVYIDGDTSIGYYRVEIGYDPTRLEYEGGATSGGEGTIIFEGRGNDTRVSTMLSFRALTGGDTELFISDAVVLISGADNENFNITETAHVPVSINGEDIDVTKTVEPKESDENISANDVEKTKDSIENTDNYEKESKDNYSVPLTIILILVGLLVVIIATLAHRRTQRGKKLRKEYLKDHRKEYVRGDDNVDRGVVKSVRKSERKDNPSVESKKEKGESETAVFPSITNGIDIKRSESIQRIEKNNKNNNNTALSTIPDEEPIIKVRDVNMKFNVSSVSSSGLKDYAIQKLKGKQNKRELRALKHISFDIYKGEVVGVIGTNGSGKSTLLKIISGAMQPTSGRVTAEKNKIQLLTLGTGFDAELTARENVYLNGAIIGYTKEFIDEHYDEIVRFAELEDFMEEKVKNFSSGMVSRLGFSIATVGGASEILILDEVLSVGDQFFRRKSMKRIKDMIHGGATVLIVSHSLSVISAHCTKVVWLDKGTLKMVGNPKSVCEEYARFNG